MTINEHSLWLHGKGFDMLGIVSLPPEPMPMQSTGVVIVVGGAQYRTGSHRQFVQLARFLAAAGFPVLRFDLPGMGDSPGELPSFEDTAPHIAAAINGFQHRHPGVERVVLWGLCDGASASLLYVDATYDARIAGLALLNPWVRSEVSLARARVKHYYWQRLREADFWRKLLTGGVGLQALRALSSNLRTIRRRVPANAASFQQRMAQGWQAFPGAIMLLLSECDLTAQEFNEYASSREAWCGWRQKPLLEQHILSRADHTCSLPGSSAMLGRHVLEFLRRRSKSAGAVEP
jgi:uncharacterized protein